MKRALPVAALLALLVAAPAQAEPRSTTRDGMTLTASKATELRVEGEKVRVTGKGYDSNKGIYVAFCVDNGPSKVPTPCGGGADTEGTSGNSVWVSSFPPAYGSGLARPYGDGGSFDVEIHVKALLRPDDPETEQDETVDCRKVVCGVVTRNDHTRSDDRSQDVVVPVSFGAATAGAAPVPAPAAPARGGSTAAGTDSPRDDTQATTGPAAGGSVAVSPAAIEAGAGASAAPSATASAAPRETDDAPLLANGSDDGSAASLPPDDGAPLGWLLTGLAALAALAAGVVWWRRPLLRARRA